jgi:hypothetical protein
VPLSGDALQLPICPYPVATVDFSGVLAPRVERLP